MDVLSGNSTLEQSYGRIIRRDQIEHTVRVLAEDRKQCSAPEGRQINRCFSPEFGNNLFNKIRGGLSQEGKLNMKLLLSLLRDRNITAVNLRPVLREVRVHGDTVSNMIRTGMRGVPLPPSMPSRLRSDLTGWRLNPATAIGPEIKLQAEIWHGCRSCGLRQ